MKLSTFCFATKAKLISPSSSSNTLISVRFTRYQVLLNNDPIKKICNITMWKQQNFQNVLFTRTYMLTSTDLCLTRTSKGNGIILNSEICFWCLFCCISGKLKSLCILLWLFRQPGFWSNWPEFLQLFPFLLFAYCVPRNWFSFLCKTDVFYVTKFTCELTGFEHAREICPLSYRGKFCITFVCRNMFTKTVFGRLCFGVKWCFAPCNSQPYQFYHDWGYYPKTCLKYQKCAFL